jgi:hypothetical protein
MLVHSPRATVSSKRLSLASIDFVFSRVGEADETDSARRRPVRDISLSEHGFVLGTTVGRAIAMEEAGLAVSIVFP